MESWFVLLALFLPPLALATLPPRTEKWRRARRRFWFAAFAGGATAALAVAFINPLGPAVVWLGALFLVVTTLATGLHAAKTIRGERLEWRETVGTRMMPAPKIVSKSE